MKNIKARKAKRVKVMKMIRAFNNLEKEPSSTNNLKITKSLSLRKTQSMVEMLKKRKTVVSGKRCKRQPKKGNSKLRKSSRVALIYST